MAKIKYQVIVDGEVLDERKSDRVYSHAVAVRPSLDDALKGAVESHEQYEKNYRYSVRYAGLSVDQAKAKIAAECVGRLAWYAEPQLRDLDKDMAKCEAYKAQYPSYESWHEAYKAKCLAEVENKKAAGYYDSFKVLCYCGRPDLAQKEAAKARGNAWNAEVRILEAVAVAPKAKAA